MYNTSQKKLYSLLLSRGVLGGIIGRPIADGESVFGKIFIVFANCLMVQKRHYNDKVGWLK